MVSKRSHSWTPWQKKKIILYPLGSFEQLNCCRDLRGSTTYASTLWGARASWTSARTRPKKVQRAARAPRRQTPWNLSARARALTSRTRAVNRRRLPVLPMNWLPVKVYKVEKTWRNGERPRRSPFELSILVGRRRLRRKVCFSSLEKPPKNRLG